MRILGHDYTLKFVQKQIDGGMDKAGRCHSGQQVIQISTDQHKQAQESTIIHEIIEALDYHLEIGLEHTQISSLEAGLYQTFSENGVKLTPLMKENNVRPRRKNEGRQPGKQAV